MFLIHARVLFTSLARSLNVILLYQRSHQHVKTWLSISVMYLLVLLLCLLILLIHLISLDFCINAIESFKREAFVRRSILALYESLIRVNEVNRSLSFPFFSTFTIIGQLFFFSRLNSCDTIRIFLR